MEVVASARLGSWALIFNRLLALASAKTFYSRPLLEMTSSAALEAWSIRRRRRLRQGGARSPLDPPKAWSIEVSTAVRWVRSQLCARRQTAFGCSAGGADERFGSRCQRDAECVVPRAE